MKPEKREWQRQSVNLSARCRPWEDPSSYENVSIIDIHHKGCCFSSSTPFQRGDKVRLLIDLGQQGRVDLTAEVAWSKPHTYRVGVNFLVETSLDEQALVRLYRFCSMPQ